MMTHTRIGILMALLVTLSSTAQAADSNGRYVAYGRGNDTCSEAMKGHSLGPFSLDPIAAEKVQKDFSDRINWVAGFLTGINSAMPETYHILGGLVEDNLFAVLRWVDEYCLRNPRKKLTHAFHAYVKAAYPSRTTQGPTEPLPEEELPQPPPTRLQAPQTPAKTGKRS